MIEISFHPDHLADLRHSGLNDATIDQAGFYSAPPADIPKILGFNPGTVESAMVLPYFDESGSQNGFKRLKVFPPILNADGKLSKYLQHKGSRPRLYILPSIREHLGDPSSPLAIVEGEKKTAKAIQEGIPALGLAGLWNFVKKGTATLIEDFDRIELSGRNVRIIVDSDVWHDSDPKKESTRQQPIFALGKLL